VLYELEEHPVVTAAFAREALNHAQADESMSR